MAQQNIQWFPGHMHKAAKALRGVYSRIHVFIEVLDARIPFSSENPMLEELRGVKPVVKVLSRADLADPVLTKTWLEHFSEQEGVHALAMDARRKGAAAPLPKLCTELYRRHGGARKQVMALVAGIPNVGKSTLINAIAGSAIAKTGNEPAMTRQQQFVEVGRGFSLLDSPGLMWPDIKNRAGGFRLALTGAVRDTALPHYQVALFALEFLSAHHRRALAGRYGLDECGLPADELLNAIGRRRGCLMKGGAVDTDRAAKIIIGDVREGRFGRLTWETPAQRAKELHDLAGRHQTTSRKADFSGT